MAEKIEKGVRARHTNSSIVRSALMRLRIGLRRFYKHIPQAIRWLLVTLFAIAVLSFVVLLVSDLIGSSSSKKQLTKEAIVKESESRVLQLAAAVSILRDTIGTDSIFVKEIKSDIPAPELFETIFHLDSVNGSKFSDIYQFLESGKYPFLKGRGVAYYDRTKHLTAWNSSKIGTANFDSVFSFASLLEKRSKMIFLDNEQIFSWIVSIRKIISKDGAMLGYVAAKAMVGVRFPYGGTDHPLTIFDDIIAKAGREVQFSFTRMQSDSAHTGTTYPIFLEPNDSSSVVGYLTIGEVPVIQSTRLQKTVAFTGDCAFSIFITILIWLLAWYIAQGGAEKASFVSKAMSLGGVFLFLGLGRMLLVVTGSLSAIFPQSLNDPQDFALVSVFGLFANPLQLFTTILFVTTFLALSWVIYVPKNSSWNAPSGQSEEASMFSTAGWLARIAPILLMILFLPLVNTLFVNVCNILVSNGSYHYLGNRFGFTRGSFTLMEASFLLVGVCYFFLVLLIMLLTLRSMIRITASELSPTRSYFAHYLLFTIILTLTGWLLSPPVLSIYPEIYWPIISFLLCVLTVIIFSRDVAMLRSGQRDPSFFYRLPRSGLALLFLLTGAGFLLSPILATQEYANDIEIIKQNLRQNSKSSDLNYSAFLDQTFLVLDGNEQSTFPASFRTSSDIKNLAFDLWLAQFSETSGKNVVIEVQDLHGATLSHFARNASKEDEARLKGIRDSLVRTLLKENGGAVNASGASDYEVGSYPCFTTSCTPAAIGVGFLDLSRRYDIRRQMADSAVRTRMVVSISIWN
ncbi:MAG: hypothetical protein Q8919_12350, partial [Bacteroidota bacterium]|nr:hypothetical protein [Bacteroidota bacterium]